MDSNEAAAVRGTLYVVATPIGHLKDITLRAIEVLGAVDIVLAEDTRRTRALLSHLGIEHKPVLVLNAHATPAELATYAERLLAGESAAIVTDAGMPAVSDPGTELVRAAVSRGVCVVPVVGPSALTGAIAASGLVDKAFYFAGFLPRSGTERAAALARVVGCPDPVVLFESPMRISATLRDLSALAPERAAMVAREMTKMHEEFVRGSLAELAALDREWLGEITLVVGPGPAPDEASKVTDALLDQRIDEELGRGAHAKSMAERLGAWSGRPKREVYERILARKRA